MDSNETVDPTTLVQSDREAVRVMLSRLRQHRLKHNWSQAEMARRVGLSRAAYQDFENGYSNITLTNLAKVLGVLGLTGQPPADRSRVCTGASDERRNQRRPEPVVWPI